MPGRKKESSAKERKKAFTARFYFNIKQKLFHLNQLKRNKIKLDRE
jgi:hypothetical protein